MIISTQDGLGGYFSSKLDLKHERFLPLRFFNKIKVSSEDILPRAQSLLNTNVKTKKQKSTLPQTQQFLVNTNGI